MPPGIILTILLASTQPTNFGIRVVRDTGPRYEPPAPKVVPDPVQPFDLNSASRLGSQWGRVTSTVRSVEHNRVVGGVRNSYHLSGRAIDIARAGNVRHWQIDAAYRKAGYAIIESLDEGDHSHFAFSTASVPVRNSAPARGTTNWGIRYAPAR